jgi:hypothetical protein
MHTLAIVLERQPLEVLDLIEARCPSQDPDRCESPDRRDQRRESWEDLRHPRRHRGGRSAGRGRDSTAAHPVGVDGEETPRCSATGR